MNGIDVIEALQFLAKDPNLDPADAAELKAGANRIVARRAAEDAEAERDRKHAEILPLCGAARERFERLNQRIAEDLNPQVLLLNSDLQAAMHALAKHRTPTPGSPYPTAKELKRYADRERELELQLLAAQNAVRELNETRGRVHQELLRAKTEFDNLAFRERQLRARETPEPANRLTLRAVI